MPINWSDLQHFLAVHRAGTFAAAARQLDVDATTVGRRLGALEKAIGGRLLERGAHRFALTSAGERVIASIEGMEALTQALQRQVSADTQVVAGVVRVAATDAMAAHNVLPHLARFEARFPEVELELITGNPSVSLSHRDADLALRLLRPTQAGLYAKRVARIAVAPYAAKRYLARHGAPQDGFDGHRVVGYSAEARAWPEAAWLAQHAARARTAVRVNSVFAVAAAVGAGAGVGLLPCGMGDRDEALERIGGPARGLEREVWLVVHQDLRHSPRIRAVWDFLVEVLEREADALRGRLQP